ncbi:MAG: hypothetical protein QN173_04510 [Armatimonadota bacterium]|nr:hypothetical protein [Armatimonadota bacterium]MDR7400895.1 hypothetical protein [Armatimonadota bacterium]MDR7404182.1 hypothetical protein [Armatimonadota bacterium]MDR7437387.1 hypothetical protein [Armatimonadota bacterium]MDR7472797.1 hypothetical protein [Armatimonadota bacterium]
MGVWRCPRCGATVTLQPQFGEIVAVYDLCGRRDPRSPSAPVRMEPVSADTVGAASSPERELVPTR